LNFNLTHSSIAHKVQCITPTTTTLAFFFFSSFGALCLLTCEKIYAHTHIYNIIANQGEIEKMNG